MARPGLAPAEHLVAGGEPVDAVTDLGHHAGQVAALARWERRRPRRWCSSPLRMLASPGLIPAAFALHQHLVSRRRRAGGTSRT